MNLHGVVATSMMRQWTVILMVLHASDSFTSLSPSSRSTMSFLCAKRRGKLANNLVFNQEGQISKILTNKEKQRTSQKRPAKISPQLAKWAQSIDDSSSSNVNYVEFVPLEEESADNPTVDGIMNHISTILSTPNCDIPQLLANITALVDMTSDSMTIPTKLATLLSQSQSSTNYRLAWAGSDAAVCHIGTSLHKVPLARLQEVFLSLGYRRWELLEVIRILGPFPNVRNTLRGEVSVPKRTKSGRGEPVRVTVAYNSMIDGTGKEILAGKSDNVKYVMLDVWFVSEKAMVCTVVESTEESEGSGQRNTLTSDNGNKVLLFVAEENLDDALEKLRAA